MGTKKDRFQRRPKKNSLENDWGYEVIDTLNLNKIKYSNTGMLIKKSYSLSDDLKESLKPIIGIIPLREDANRILKERSQQVTYWLNHYEPKQTQ